MAESAESPDPVARFRRAAAATPDRIAVHAADGSLTFAELDARTAQLAGRLRALGIGRGDRVGVGLRRGVDWVAAPLAVWRAGAAYVPLDPAYPDDRLALIAGDADLRAVVSDGGRAPWLGEALPVLAASGHEAAGPAGESGAGGLDPAYVIYTSGSTGRPKGVEVTRGGVAALLAGLEERGVYPAEHRVVGWNASMSFDASVQQWARVCRGDTVVVLAEEDRTEPERLVALLGRHRVTELDVTPSHWRLLAPHLAPGGGLRLLIGGEPVPERMWRELADDDGLEAWNVYGPTECTVDATATRITGGRPHLGHPLDTVRAHVLDAGLAPATTGELYLAGPGVATGYVGRPGQTAERFVADPFAADGSRMYRTGDAARRRDDGTLEFLGRTDRQIKVRGFRVELGEVEERLRAHPEVTAAVVTLVAGPDGDTLLAAHWVADPGSALTDDELRAYCSRTLPAHAVPSALVRLDALPLTSNGKVDHRALPAPRATPATATATDGQVLDGELEHLIAGVWAEVLGRDTIHADDDFFALGGHSLVALRVVSRLKRSAGVILPTKDVYRFPQLRELARHAESVRTGASAR